MRVVGHRAFSVGGVQLWGVGNPYLYKVVTTLRENGRVLDEEVRPFGCRWISWPAGRQEGDGRFFLNGEPVFINGVGEYEHILGHSHAMEEAQIVARVRQIRAAGFNAFRDAHQPHNLRYMDQWERLGVLFWTQFSAHVWYDTPGFRNQFKRNLREWVRERRSSPAVVLWGLQNESVLPEGFARECVEIIREMDPTSPSQRLVTTCNGGVGTDWNVVQNWSGTYGGRPERYAQELSGAAQLLNGEYGAWRSIGLHSDSASGKLAGRHTETAMCHLLEEKIRLAESVSDSVCGQFHWIFSSHDNPGREQNEEGVRDIDRIGPFNYKGLITPWDEPVDAYYLYRSNYAPAASDPMVYIVSHTWNDRFANSAPNGEISVYSNCEEVELFNDVDALSLGKRERGGKGTHFRWPADGIHYNVVKAVGYMGGKPVASDVIVLDSLPAAPHFEELYEVSADVVAPVADLHYLYRVNCGGPDFVDAWGNKWHGDQKQSPGFFFGSHSWADDYPHLPAFLASQRMTGDPIAGTRHWALGQTFRYGRERLQFHFPLPDGDYHIELFFVEPWWGAAGVHAAGFRRFDVAVSGDILLKNLDIWAEAGHDRLLKKVLWGKAKDGLLTVSFPHVASGQAIVAAIAIASTESNIVVAPPSPPFVPHTEVPKEPEQRPAQVCPPPAVDAHRLTWTITPGLASVYALRFRYQNFLEKALDVRIHILSSDGRVMREDALHFPPTNGKWRMLNTTTEVEINAGTYRVVLESENIDALAFERLEIQ
jgi:hypothetical protein